MGKNRYLTYWSHSFYYIWAASRPNQQNGMCAHWRLRSTWASAQSDQSLLCPHEEGWSPSLSLERTAKPLIRLGDLSLRWTQRSFCWLCHEAAHFTLSHLRQQYWFLLIQGVLFPEILRESEGFYVSMHMYVSVYYVILQTSSNTHLYLPRRSTRVTVHIAF